MNANARKWVEALRSEEFTQTTGALRVNDSHCCLGVACELYRRDLGVGRWIPDNHADGWEFAVGDEPHAVGDGGILPAPVSLWLGLRSQGGAYNVEGVEDDLTDSQLSADNDNGKSFAEIADLIESEPFGLFA